MESEAERQEKEATEEYLAALKNYRKLTAKYYPAGLTGPRERFPSAERITEEAREQLKEAENRLKKAKGEYESALRRLRGSFDGMS